MYREQCITAEEEVARVREEITHNQKLFQTRTGKLIDKLELTTKVRLWHPVKYSLGLQTVVGPTLKQLTPLSS